MKTAIWCAIWYFSVLGHRRSVTDPLVLPTSDMQPWQPVVNCATEMERKLKLLLRNFQGDSGLLSVNIGWKGGVHAQSCGHYVHLDCHSSYMKSLSVSHSYFINIRVANMDTVRCRYNAINFVQNPHNRHPIARPWGRGMGRLLWF